MTEVDTVDAVRQAADYPPSARALVGQLADALHAARTVIDRTRAQAGEALGLGDDPAGPPLLGECIKRLAAARDAADGAAIDLAERLDKATADRDRMAAESDLATAQATRMAAERTDLIATLAERTAERDRARDIAVALEQENAVGRAVICDWCNTDLTDDTRTGGFLFQSKAVGPCCAETTMATIRGYGEERFIRGRCTPGMAFADWVRELRTQVPGGDSITIVRGNDIQGALDQMFGGEGGTRV